MQRGNTEEADPAVPVNPAKHVRALQVHFRKYKEWLNSCGFRADQYSVSQKQIGGWLTGGNDHCKLVNICDGRAKKRIPARKDLLHCAVSILENTDLHMVSGQRRHAKPAENSACPAFHNALRSFYIIEAVNSF
jgi:hypothetical protein